MRLRGGDIYLPSTKKAEHKRRRIEIEANEMLVLADDLRGFKVCTRGNHGCSIERRVLTRGVAKASARGCPPTADATPSSSRLAE